MDSIEARSHSRQTTLALKESATIFSRASSHFFRSRHAMITRAPEHSHQMMSFPKVPRTSSSEVMSHFSSNACVRTGDDRRLAEQLFVPLVLSFDEVVSESRMKTRVNWPWRPTDRLRVHRRCQRRRWVRRWPISWTTWSESEIQIKLVSSFTHLWCRWWFEMQNRSFDYLSVDVVFIKFLQDLFSMRVSRTPMKFRETNMDDNNINK